MNPEYIACFDKYLEELFGQIRPLLCTNGGPIIMLQCENEYGYYGDDRKYLAYLKEGYERRGIDVPLFTSDGTWCNMLSGGTLEGVLPTLNFGSRTATAFSALEPFGEVPRMCMEFWCGWFDHWYEEHHVREAEELAGLFRDMLNSGASLNFYMFHGGTNFGFMNGANHGGKYQPTITSYDYNALLSEAGDMTPAYHAVRKINEEFFGALPELTCKNSEKKAYGKVELTEKAFVLDTLESICSPVHTAEPKYMEQIGQGYGFTLYSTTVRGPITDQRLEAEAIHDRAIVYIDGEKKGWYERSAHEDEVRIDLRTGEQIRMDILVENMGRINYGPLIRDKKGMTGIRFGQRNHYGWKMYPLEMKDLSKVQYEPCDGGVDKSSFMKGVLNIEGEPKDTFIRLDGFHHGFVMVNGFNLGRYYNDAGPQKTLYIPAPLLKTGSNEIIIFETDGFDVPVVTFTDAPDLG